MHHTKSKSNIVVLPICLKNLPPPNSDLSSSTICNGGLSNTSRYDYPETDRYYVNKDIIATIQKRYENLMKDLQLGKKIENNIFIEEINQSSSKTSIETHKKCISQSTIASNKYNRIFSKIINRTKVIHNCPKICTNIRKKINSDEVFSVPILKKSYNESDEFHITNIQKTFRGYKEREIDHILDRLKVEQCSIETLSLLIGKNYNKAQKRIAFKKLELKEENPDRFCKIINEFNLKDKIKLKTIKNYYNVSGIKRKNYVRKKVK